MIQLPRFCSPHRDLFFSLLSSSFLLLGCSTDDSSLQLSTAPASSHGKGYTLRAPEIKTDLSQDLFIVGGDIAAGKDTTLWYTRGKLSGNTWKLEEKKEIEGPGYLFAFYPDKGFKIDQNNNIFFAYKPGDMPLLYAKMEYDKNKTEHVVALKNLMTKFTVRLDFSEYSGARHIDKIELAGTPWRANINVKTGEVFYAEEYDFVSVGISDEVVKGDLYDVCFYTFPMPKGKTPTLKLFLDGKVFTLDLLTASDREWKSGDNYVYTAKVKSLRSRTAIDVSEDVRSHDKMEVYDITEAPYFRLATTSGQWHILPKNQTTVLGIFVENMTDNDFNGDVRLALEDEAGNVVQQGTYWSQFPIKSYEFDGLRLPFIARVPAGEYSLQVYLRKEGDTKWFKPQIMEDLSGEKDFKVTVTDDYPAVRFSVSYWREKDQNEGPFYESLISTVRVGIPYKYSALLNSYENVDKQATIRLYHYRNTANDGYSIYRDKGKSTTASWKDLLAQKRVTVKAGTETKVEFPYRFVLSRPVVDRFCGYLYATIQYDGGKEYPLQVDANNLYKTSQEVSVIYNPNGGGLWHYIAAFNLSTIHYVTMAE